MTEETEILQTAPRDIVVTNKTIEYGNIEAWINIIESYKSIHPGHDVVIMYEGEAVRNIFTLYKMDDDPNLNGFQLIVRAADGNWKDVPKLYRFLVEGASPKYDRYIEKEMYQVLKLF